MTERTYLDWNATAPLRPQARAAMLAALEATGNPSSVHSEGRVARRLIEGARAAVAALVGTEPRNVVFTSGGTEANTLALSPGWTRDGWGAGCDRLLVSAIEHPSVLAGGRFTAERTSRVPVTADGVVDLTALQALLAQAGSCGERPLVSLMLANNETGVIQPVAEAAGLVHAAGGLLHADAVQAAGRMAVSMADLGADLLTLSAHKIGGPRGVGALVRADDGLHLAEPLIRGGGQERNLRAGTENVAGIAGFGAAATAVQAGFAAESAHMLRLRSRLEEGLQKAVPGVVVFGSAASRLPNTTLFAATGIKAETAIIALDLDGLAVSSGSACSSGKVQQSHVLAAMGVEPGRARGGIRISVGATTSQADIDCFLEAFNRLAGALGKERRGMAA